MVVVVPAFAKMVYDDCVYFNTDYNMWMCNDASELEEDKEESKMLRGEVAVE